MRNLVLILGDQLSDNVSALDGFDPSCDAVVMAEVQAEATYVRHHQHKLVLIFSAMRHFAAQLRERGCTIFYQRLDDENAVPDLLAMLQRLVAAHAPQRLIVTRCGEWRLQQQMERWPALLEIAVELRDDSRFFCRLADFQRWAGARKQLRMEYFYRDMRRASGLLMEGDQPLGGRWNFDTDNRRRYDAAVPVPSPPRFEPDAITREVMAMVQARFADHPGSVDNFAWAVTAHEAAHAFDHFVRHALAWFGDYQDAMQADQPHLFHSLISPYLNIGLLDARAICAQVDALARAGTIALNSAEGFIRQILGWREYVRGIYWWQMPGYRAMNVLNASRPLPHFYWSGDTRMRCLATAISDTLRHGYAHHIQRLMVTGNFALLCDIDIGAITDWYLAVYIDAFEWVELPNTLGMVMHADGGLMASKPYCAGGAYMQRMSDYCKGCFYDVRKSTGARACPLNSLYWDFLERHRDRLGSNPRLALAYRNLDRQSPTARAALRQQARIYLEKIETL
jgi:deoxyribodipyrimidine photolyase-related protein